MPAASLVEDAPAKVNLTLRVLGRRADGYHELESLVVFAGVGDRLTLRAGRRARARRCAARPRRRPARPPTISCSRRRRALADEAADRRRSARFALDKRLPVAAGLGGGSSDAAAALRLLARANELAPDDPLLYAAARATGADVPVCLDPRPRLMRGIGEMLSRPFTLPPLPAVLVNPGVAVPTKDVFARWKPPAAPWRRPT